MRKTTSMMAQWKAETAEGETLTFEKCKGGFFSDIDEYGLKLVGKTAQEKKTGKNLFDVSKVGKRGSESASNIKNNGDGTLTVNTKASTGITSSTLLKEAAKLVVGETYVLNGSVAPDITNKQIYLNGSGKTWAFGVPLTITQSHLDSKLTFYGISNVDTDVVISNIQIEKSSTPTAYEPYCGGMPSPNPEYPEPIRCVKAGTKVQVCGENLFNLEDAILTGCIIENDTIKTTQSPHNIDYYLKAGTYTLFLTKTGNSPIYLRKGQNKLGFFFNSDANNIIASFTFENDEYLRISSFVTNVVFSKIMILKGVYDVKPPYKSYQGNEITLPVDLYEGDIWYPMSGKVERYNRVLEFNGTEYWSKFYENYSNKIIVYMYIPDKDVSPVLDTNIGYGITTHIREHSYPTTVNATYNNAVAFTASTQQIRLSLKDTVINDLTLEGFKVWLAEQAANGTPFTAVYKTKKYIEKVEPAPISMPTGTVNVIQIPTQLTGTMSATALVRR